MIIEEVIINYLIDVLQTSEVYAEVPETHGDEFFVVDKTGGGREDRVNHAMITVQSYAKTKDRAAARNEDVKAAMERIVILNEIGACHLNTDYNFTNIDMKQYRYQAVFDITHY